MSRGLNDPGINPSFSGYMEQLNEKVQNERDNNFSIWKAAAQKSRDEKIKASEKRVQERIEAIEREEAEALKKDYNIDSKKIEDAYKELAQSLETSTERQIIATIV